MILEEGKYYLCRDRKKIMGPLEKNHGSDASDTPFFCNRILHLEAPEAKFTITSTRVWGMHGRHHPLRGMADDLIAEVNPNDYLKRDEGVELLKEGSYYLTRNGLSIIGPIDEVKSHAAQYPFYCDQVIDKNTLVIKRTERTMSWTRYGRWSVSDSSGMDLIKEVPNPFLITKKENTMANVLPVNTKSDSLLTKITNGVKSVREKIRPYDKYIVMAAVVIAIDYFVFDGKISEKTKEIFKRLSNKFLATLDKVIDKIGE